MITKFSKNCLGTLSFDGKFDGMRKEQDFIVYPLSKDKPADKITIQSDTRIGTITLIDGSVRMSPSVPSGAFFHHMVLAKTLSPLTAEELLLLKANILSTASASAGSHGLTCDNTSAIEVFAN